jgi:hypothetical protein
MPIPHCTPLRPSGSPYPQGGYSRDKHRQGAIDDGSERVNRIMAKKRITQITNRPQLGSLYHQCKTARAASLAYSCTNVEVGKDTGTTKTVNFSSIGSLNCIGDSEVLNTFRGSRLNSNNTDVNQNISLGFDPATLTCVSC